MVDAAVLLGQEKPSSPALSLPRMQANDPCVVGQPRPRYSTVSEDVWPHVVTVSVPPKTAPEPRLRKYTTRGPPKYVTRPLQ